MISVRVNEIVVRIHESFISKLCLMAFDKFFYVQSILQKLAIWWNNPNGFYRFETKGKKHNQITVTAN